MTQLEKYIHLFINTRNVIPTSHSQHIELDGLMVQYNRKILEASYYDINSCKLLKQYYDYLNDQIRYTKSFDDHCFLKACQNNCRDRINDCATNICDLVV